MSLWSAPFWLAALERSIKTIAQTAAALLVAAGSGILDADWIAVISVAAMAGLVSILTSVGTGLATDGSPSVGGVEILPARRAYTTTKPEES